MRSSQTHCSRWYQTMVVLMGTDISEHLWNTLQVTCRINFPGVPRACTARVRCAIISMNNGSLVNGVVLKADINFSWSWPEVTYSIDESFVATKSPEEDNFAVRISVRNHNSMSALRSLSPHILCVLEICRREQGYSTLQLLSEVITPSNDS